MYPEGEALILTRLQAISGFTSANTSRGKWGILNSGVNSSGNSACYAILKPGEFRREQGAMSMNISFFRTVIQVYQRYKDDGDTLTDLEANVKAIINYFDTYPQISDGTQTIVEAFIVGGSEVIQLQPTGGGITWLRWDLYLDWQEHDVVTYAE